MSEKRTRAPRTRRTRTAETAAVETAVETAQQPQQPQIALVGGNATSSDTRAAARAADAEHEHEHETAQIVISEDAASVFTPDDRAALAQLDQHLPTIDGEIAHLRAHLDEIEQHEHEREQTALALRLEIVSCEFATTHFAEGRILPTFAFETIKCPFGKSQPDQSCRSCVHAQYVPVGAQHAPHMRRYVRHGYVFPIKDEKHAEQLGKALDMLDVAHLRSPRAELAALEVLREQALARRAEITRRRDEAQQRGMRVE